MWFKKKPKHLHGIDSIASYFKINSMDLMTWHRSRADPPPMWRCGERFQWHTEIRKMKRWLKKNNLLPKRVSLFEMFKIERERRHDYRKKRNAENWQRTIQRQHRRDWQVTDDHLRKKRLW
jgi:hypothetical protein